MNHGGHGRGGHGDDPFFPLRRSALSPEQDLVTGTVIGAAIAVHRTLGPGFLESIYQKAMVIELRRRGLAFEQQVPVRVDYCGVAIPGQRVDLIVENTVIVELKAVKRLDDIHCAQVLSYLKTVELRVGLLINFRVTLLRHGIRRIVNTP